MIKPIDFPGTYAEFYQQVIKPMEDAITPAQRAANAASHVIGNVDGVARCIDCEIGSWNAWKEECWNV